MRVVRKEEEISDFEFFPLLKLLMPDLSSDIKRRILRSIQPQKEMILKDVFCVLSKAFNIRYSMIFEHSLYMCVCV